MQIEVGTMTFGMSFIVNSEILTSNDLIQKIRV